MNRQQKQTNRKLRKESKLHLNDTIDKIARDGAKDAVESALLVERDDFLARNPHQRVTDKDFRGYRNGYRPRSIGLVGGQTAIKMPRVSNSEEPFESKILPPYLSTTPAVLNTLPQLYLYGLSSGDFREALAILLGKDAVLSPCSLMRLIKRKVLDALPRNIKIIRPR